MAQTNLNSVFSLKSGLAKNYVTGGDFENASVSGWNLVNTTLSATFVPNSSTAAAPFSLTNGGTAASANLATSLISGGAQLSSASGSYSLGLASSSAGVAGDMLISPAFSIDKMDQTHALAWRFAYSVISGSANMSFTATNSQTWAIWFFDVANGVWIQPSGCFTFVQSAGTGYAYGTIQAASNATQYQIALVQTTAATGAFNIYVDDFYCGPQGNIVGVAGSDLVSYGATTIGITSGTAPTKAPGGNIVADKLEGKRIGDIGYVAITYEQNAAGTAGTATQDYLYNLPPGWSFNLNVYPAYQGSVATQMAENSVIPKSIIPAAGFYSFNATDYAFLQGIIPWNSTQFRVYINYQVGADQFCQGSGLMPLSAAGIGYSFSFSAPMAGWSTNSALSSDVPTRQIVASAHVSAGASTTAGTQINFDTVDWDNNGLITTGVGAWSFKANQPGYYGVKFSVIDGATAGNFSVYKNGALFRFIGASITTSGFANGSTEFPLNANDTIDIRCTATITPASATGITVAQGNWITVSLLQAPVSISAADSVQMSYDTSSSSVTGSLATITYSNKIQDTHNQYVSGVYTVVDPGAYMVVANLAVAATYALNNNLDLQVQQAGSASKIAEDKPIAAGAVSQLSAKVMDIFHCLANDTITVKASCSGTGPTVVSSANQNNFSIVRVGNY